MINDWYGRHPFISDLIVLLSPGLLVFIMWMILGLDTHSSLLQGIATSVFVFGLLLYLKIKHNTKIFRYFNI